MVREFTPLSYIKTITPKLELLKFQLIDQNQIEPLELLVNPTSIDYKFGKENFRNQTREGWVTEHWGDALDGITLTGYIGGFYSKEFGLTSLQAHDTDVYKHFYKIFEYYRRNGYNYFDPEIEKKRNSIKGNLDYFNMETLHGKYISTIGQVRMYWDRKVYIGQFDEFNITETDDKPFTLEYSLTLTSRGGSVDLYGKSLTKSNTYGHAYIPDYEVTDLYHPNISQTSTNPNAVASIIDFAESSGLVKPLRNFIEKVEESPLGKLIEGAENEAGKIVNTIEKWVEDLICPNP